MARGSPSMVNGVGLRLPSLRGSWVRIPPPALLSRRETHFQPNMLGGNDFCLGRISLDTMSIV